MKPRLNLKCLSGLILLALAPALMAQTAAPVGWWQGEGNENDSISTNNGLANLTYVAGHTGQAWRFNGALISVPDASDLTPSNVTVQAWVKGGPFDGTVTFHYILAKVGGPAGVSYGLYSQPSGGLNFIMATPTTSSNSQDGLVLSPGATDAQVWDNNWHQITGSYDGTAAHLYVDGVEIGSGTAVAGLIDYSSSGPLFIGALTNTYNPTLYCAYRNCLDDLKVYGRALSAQEVAQSFSDGSAVTNGLVSWWQAEGNAQDSRGTHNGTVTGRSIGFISGKFGQAFLIGDNVLTIPDSPVFETPAVSVEAWVKSSSPGTFIYLVSKSIPTIGSYALYTADSGGLAFFVNTSQGLSLSPEASPNLVWDGARHHVAGTYDGSLIHLYLDGLEIGSGTAASGDIVYSTNVNGGALVIGSDSLYDSTFTYLGGVDELKVYDHALSASNVLADFTADGLVSWWRAETNTVDSIGKNPGTAVGDLEYVASMLTGTAFSTANGLVDVPDSPSLEPSAQTSVSALVRSAPPTPGTYLVSKSLTASNASYALLTGPGGGLAFSVAVAGSTVLSPEAPSTLVWDGAFHAVAGAYDGAGVHLYVDGAEIGTGTAASGAITYGASVNGGDLLIGSFNATPSSANFPGLIDEVKLWNRGLTAADAEAEAFNVIFITSQPQNVSAGQGENTTLSVSALGPQPLQYQWLFNGSNLAEATNATLTLDSVQSDQSGQYQVQVDTKSMTFVTNDLLGGLAFHTAGSVVDIPNNDTLQPQQLTVQLWARDTSPGAYQYLISKTHGSGVSSYAFYTGGSDGLFFYLALVGGGFFITPDAGTGVWDGHWHQITVHSTVSLSGSMSMAPRCSAVTRSVPALITRKARSTEIWRLATSQPRRTPTTSRATLMK